MMTIDDSHDDVGGSGGDADNNYGDDSHNDHDGLWKMDMDGDDHHHITSSKMAYGVTIHEMTTALTTPIDSVDYSYKQR